MYRRLQTLLCASAFAGLLFPVTGQAVEVSFERDVMAAITKTGCNIGGCHGNQSGKASFKLSLWGSDPDYDYDALTRDFFGRRIDSFNPDQSLLLLKGSASLAHEGGQRFTKDSLEYKVIRDWIAAGAKRDPTNAPKVVKLDVTPLERILIAPDKSFNIKATATFSDGTTRDVTRIATYAPASPKAAVSIDGKVELQNDGETSVLVRYLNQHVSVRTASLPNRPFKWQNPTAYNYVDRHIFTKLQKMRVNASAVSADHEFIRRAYLDLHGLLPTAEQARQFVADKDPQKRSKLIDRLLEQPEYADFWALKWSDLLRNEEKSLDRKGVQSLHAWIRQSFAENKPLDQFARELVSARGSTYANPPANYYRASRDASTRAETTAQLFLGSRLSCARCHNHPFERWTQDDYYDWAGLFARIDYKIIENKRRDRSDLNEFVGEQIVFFNERGEVKNARTGNDAKPRFLGMTKSTVALEDDRLAALGDWLASPKNEMFVRAQVNRIWFHLMGRGIVDPVDDFSVNNLPSHPELLDALSADFVKNKFDVKQLIRTIMNSRSYQISSTPNESNADDVVNYSRNIPRRMQAELILDAAAQLTGTTLRFNGYPEGTRATQIPGVEAVRRRDAKSGSGEENFLQTFGKPPRLISTECERSNDTTMGQAFQLISGPLLNGFISRENNRIDTLIKAGKTNEQIIDELFWTATSRAPGRDEMGMTMTHLKEEPDRRKALEDVLWALLNAKEFVLRY
ncbi:MAG TPA: DUF1549 and DUF1553 domain-containing protein [Verrucomicrobiae bacterium]